MNDDPFSRGNKTVIRPNPGGRAPRPAPIPGSGRSGQTSPPHQARDGARDPFSSSGSDAGSGSSPFQAPSPGQSPFSAPPAVSGADRTVIVGRPGEVGSSPRVGPSSYPAPSPRTPFLEASGDGQWMGQAPGQEAFFPQKKKDVPQAPRAMIPLEVALNARNSAKVSSSNQMMTFAAPLLILLGRLRQSVVEMHAVPLMEHVAEEIRTFERTALEAGEDRHDVQVAKYALCGTADDIVQNLPGTDRHVWMQYSMLAQFFGVRTSGVGFFDELNKVLANPGARYKLLELMHACLSLGFEGQYRGGGRGQADLQRIRHQAYEALRRVQARPDDDISPHWQGLGIAMRSLRSALPTWVVASLAALLLVAAFFIMRLLLTNQGEVLAATIVGLHPTSTIALERSEAVPAPQDPAPTGQLQRIKGALAAEIGAGGIEVEPVGNNIVVRVSNSLLFPSGSADVTPAFKAVADKIAAALNSEPGPIYVIGHTDNVKPSATSRFKSNFDLSVARARSVETIVGATLTDPARVKVEGKGADEPVADNATNDGRRRNRRVDVLIPKEETLANLVAGGDQTAGNSADAGGDYDESGN